MDNTLGLVDGIMVSAFAGVDGPSFTVATLELRAVGVGVSTLSLSQAALNPRDSDGQRIDPGCLDGIVRVSPIPLPAAVWLFASALLLVGRLALRSTSS